LFLTQHYTSFLKRAQLVLTVEPLACLQKLKGNSKKGMQQFSPAKFPAAKDTGRIIRPVSLYLICTFLLTPLPSSAFMDCTTFQVQSPFSFHLQRHEISMVIQALLQLENNEDAYNLASHLQQAAQAHDWGEIGGGLFSLPANSHQPLR
jgi:hypothetical protein